MSRFLFFANIFHLLMPGTIRDLIQDTKTHEAHTVALIDRYATGYSAKPSQAKFTSQKSGRSWQWAGLSDTYTGARTKLTMCSWLCMHLTLCKLDYVSILGPQC